MLFALVFLLLRNYIIINMKNLIFKLLLFSLLAAITGACNMSPYTDNFHQVDTGIYRSGQPDSDEFQELEGRGIKSVLNLRRHHRDEEKLQKTGLVLYELPLNAGSLSESELRTALLIIKHAPKPLLIHCLHGSDRTGAVVAAYRITEQGWSVDQAVDELMEEKYGHHYFWYGNISRLLRSIDWKKINGTADKTQ